MINERYRRQMLVSELGERGQDVLAGKHVLIIGGGGLGSHSASILVRMGVGRVDIIDDDVVELTNLHRTSIFSEEDVGRTKAYVLENYLKKINANVSVKGIHQQVTKDTIISLLNHVDLIIDGTDSLPLRYLINDAAVKLTIPWVYAGVQGTMGMVMGILPQKTPCLQCISQTIPEAGTSETPVLGNLPALIAAIQCTEALNLLLGQRPAGLILYDIWKQHFDILMVKKNPSCPCCKKHKFTYL